MIKSFCFQCFPSSPPFLFHKLSFYTSIVLSFLALLSILKNKTKQMSRGLMLLNRNDGFLVMGEHRNQNKKTVYTGNKIYCFRLKKYKCLSLQCSCSIITPHQSSKEHYQACYSLTVNNKQTKDHNPPPVQSYLDFFLLASSPEVVIGMCSCNRDHGWPNYCSQLH